jgi:sugar lactone lactonase YvrE
LSLLLKYYRWEKVTARWKLIRIQMPPFFLSCLLLKLLQVFYEQEKLTKNEIMKMQFVCFVFFVCIATGCTKKNRDVGNQPDANPPKEKRAVVSTVAGDGSKGFANGPALSAKFNSPADVAVGPDGSLYITDFKNHRVRKIAAGQVTTLAGNDSFGIVNGNGILSQFENPYRIALDARGNLYVTDAEDTRIRKITTEAGVSVFAGTSMPGFLNGPVAIARFQWDEGGITADVQSNMYVSDYGNHRIRKISVYGDVSTLAGNGTGGFINGDASMAEFSFPDGIAFDKLGNLYVADLGNFCIRKISPDGKVSRFAGAGTNGNADGTAAFAQFNLISDMAADSKGNLYVIDDNRVRKVTPGGIVTTIAGTTQGYGYADGDGASARFAGLGGLGIDAADNIYVADINNNRIRKISFE